MNAKAGLFALGILGGTMFGMSVPNDPIPTEPATFSLEIPPCPTEDSDGCYWDASTRGNGLGKSFVATNDGEVIWLDGWTCEAPVGMDYLCDEEG